MSSKTLQARSKALKRPRARSAGVATVASATSLPEKSDIAIRAARRKDAALLFDMLRRLAQDQVEEGRFAPRRRSWKRTDLAAGACSAP